MYIGQEKLFVKIDKFNPLSQKTSLSFDDLKGLTFLVVCAIGPWRRITEESIPDARFLYQEDVQALDELTKNSTSPLKLKNKEAIIANADTKN